MILDAAKNGDVAAIRRILDEDPAAATYRSETGETPLMAALYRGHQPAVDALVEGGAPLDLFAAAATGNVDAMESALTGSDPNALAYDGWTALHLAAFFGRDAAAARLLDAGATVDPVAGNSVRNTPLHAATAGGHATVALLLIERGADIRATDAGGHTPLHIAAENGLADVVRALMSAGADPHAVDTEDKTPMSRAAARNLPHIVDLMNDPR